MKIWHQMSMKKTKMTMKKMRRSRRSTSGRRSPPPRGNVLMRMMTQRITKSTISMAMKMKAWKRRQPLQRSRRKRQMFSPQMMKSQSMTMKRTTSLMMRATSRIRARRCASSPSHHQTWRCKRRAAVTSTAMRPSSRSSRWPRNLRERALQRERKRRARAVGDEHSFTSCRIL
jgi:hypothetical protein